LFGDYLKLAITGKGGVGKTLLAAMLSQGFAAKGFSVIAIDADPDANLGLTLGFPESGNITPIADMKELIQERTAAGEAAPYFKINPRVDDIPDKYSLKHDNIRLLVMGRPKAGGAGCYCPENAVLSALMAHLLLDRNEMVIMDMAAGIEHLSRGTARAVDRLIIVVEPGLASLETARRIMRLAHDLGIERTAVVGNKIRRQQEADFISKGLPEAEIIGFIPFDDALTQAELSSQPKTQASTAVQTAVDSILQRISG
jgi:CO dehydrogenase maturation factor